MNELPTSKMQLTAAGIAGTKSIRAASRRDVVGYLSGLIATIASMKAPWAQSVASSVRLHDHGTHTRLVFELSQALEFKIFSLSDPYRMVVDLPELDWQLEVSGQGSAGVVKDLRYGLFQPGQSRIVIDLNRAANVQRAFLLSPTAVTPWRMVIDLIPVSNVAFMNNAGPAKGSVIRRPGSISEPTTLSRDWSLADQNAEEAVPLPQIKPPTRPSNRKPVIAIDPGHGGVDPGAIGVSGVREKEITLAAAKEMKKALEQTGRYKVILTRDRDVSLGLRQRIAKSRRSSADVFVSLHADSIKRPEVRGLSVYTLSEKASDREAAALAVKENKADLIIGMDLTNESADVRNILLDLARRESLNLAAHLATKLISELRRQVKLLRNSHRFAGFVVLKAPDVPSLLLEMGYLSNKEEERALRQPGYRRKLILSIIKALDGYFGDMDVIRPT
ncbi:MAG: N-acetylmuramoyl-L-alanine amidase [Rhodospirillaceae bacterium]